MHSLIEESSTYWYTPLGDGPVPQLLLDQEIDVVDSQRCKLLVRALHIQQQPAEGYEDLTASPN